MPALSLHHQYISLSHSVYALFMLFAMLRLIQLDVTVLINNENSRTLSIMSDGGKLGVLIMIAQFLIYQLFLTNNLLNDPTITNIHCIIP